MADPLMSPETLWQLYQNTWFQWSDRPCDKPNFAIITAYNPRSMQQSEANNQAAQQRLLNQLQTRQIPCFRIRAGNRDFSYTEPSVAVGADEPLILELSKTYQQNAYYWVVDGILWLKPALLAMPAISLGAFSRWLINDASLAQQRQ